MRFRTFLIVVLLLTTTIAFSDPFNPQNYFKDRVKVKFLDETPLVLKNGALDMSSLFALQKSAQPDVRQLAERSQWLPSYDVRAHRLDEFRQIAQSYWNERLPDLNMYYTVFLPDSVSANDAIPLLEAIAIVEAVYPMPLPVEPPLAPDYTDPLNESGAYQGYLNPAPDGVDALYAWQGSGGAGRDVKIVDMEYNWNRLHSDLMQFNRKVPVIGPLPSTQLQGDVTGNQNHGTAVLGILAGVDNEYGVKGIAHDAEIAAVAQIVLQNGQAVYDNAAAILRAVDEMEKGDILLLEAQIGGPNYDRDVDRNVGLVPVEWDKPTYDAIKTAVGTGITVVEAGGNGSQNLNDDVYKQGNNGHEPFRRINDSGAILVGAGKPPSWGAQARSPFDFSNYGSRFDLQGWGGEIVTTGYGNLYSEDGTNFLYTQSFGGTSGASPIVAASAAIVQSSNKAKSGSNFSPNEVRALLVRTGTAQTGSDNIGPLPNLRAAIDEIWAEETLTVAAPVITPASGTYEMPLQATILFASGQNSTNTAIRYTLDGLDPDEDSFIFEPGSGDAIYLNYGVTLKARAFQFNPENGRRYASSVTTVVYESNTPKVATPVITPGGGTYLQNETFTLSTETPGAVIRYRTDGRAINFFYPGTEYTGPIELETGSYEIVARGYKDGYYKSDLAYTGTIDIIAITLPKPTVYPSTGTYYGGVQVYLTTSLLGGVVRYTTDGSAPDEESPVFIEPLDLEAQGEETEITVKARVYLQEYSPSDIAEQVYTILDRPAMPVISPNGGEFPTSVNVTLSSSTPGSAIRYSTNGSEPTSVSQEYTGPFQLEIGQHTVKAKTFLNNSQPSETASAEFTVYDPNPAQVATPDITPFSSQQFVEPIPLTMTCATLDATIRYTVGFGQLPPDPTQFGGESITYTGPVVIGVAGQNLFIKARAFKQGMTPSAIVQTGQLSISEPLGVVAAPTLDPPGGTYNNPVSVTVESETQFANIVYTRDGSEPSSWLPIQPPSLRYTSPVNLFRPTVFKARGYRVFFRDSDVASAQYDFQCATPIIRPDAKDHVDNVEIRMESETENASIFYTLDGSLPTAESTAYTSPFTLGPGTHTIKAMAQKSFFENSEVTARVFSVQPAATRPMITTQPQSQQSMSGIDVSLSVEASGTLPLAYQWQRDGIPIAGATEPVLEVPNVQPVDQGEYRAIVTNEAGADTSDSAELVVLPTTVHDSNALPQEFSLGSNYPNPFNPTTTIRFAVPKTSHVTLIIFNILGEHVRTLNNGTMQAGYHSIVWNGHNESGQPVPTGLYFYKMQADEFTTIKKMVLAK